MLSGFRFAILHVRCQYVSNCATLLWFQHFAYKVQPFSVLFCVERH